MKTLSIIGMVFSVVFLLWFGLFAFGDTSEASTNGRISREEFGPIGIFLFMLTFSIVAIRHSLKK